MYLLFALALSIAAFTYYDNRYFADLREEGASVGLGALIPLFGYGWLIILAIPTLIGLGKLLNAGRSGFFISLATLPLMAITLAVTINFALQYVGDLERRVIRDFLMYTSFASTLSMIPLLIFGYIRVRKTKIRISPGVAPLGTSIWKKPYLYLTITSLYLVLIGGIWVILGLWSLTLAPTFGLSVGSMIIQYAIGNMLFFLIMIPGFVVGPSLLLRKRRVGMYYSLIGAILWTLIWIALATQSAGSFPGCKDIGCYSVLGINYSASVVTVPLILSWKRIQWRTA